MFNELLLDMTDIVLTILVYECWMNGQNAVGEVTGCGPWTPLGCPWLCMDGVKTDIRLTLWSLSKFISTDQ